jgi:HSP20 family molecular chaperone IbpA
MALDDPFSALRRASDQLERLFHDFVGGRPRTPRAQAEGPAGWAPQVEISQRRDDYVVSVDLPGIRREDVQVDIDDRLIVIRGERRQSPERSNGGVLRSECNYGRFYRAVQLPEGANADAARAAMRDGVLEIVLPTPPRRQPRRLEIEDRDPGAREDAYRYRAAEPANEPQRQEPPGSEQDRRGERRDWQGEGRLGM